MTSEGSGVADAWASVFENDTDANGSFQHGYLDMRMPALGRVGSCPLPQCPVRPLSNALRDCGHSVARGCALPTGRAGVVVSLLGKEAPSRSGRPAGRRDAVRSFLVSYYVQRNIVPN